MQLPSLSAAIARRSNDPCPTILSCPINSSRERGRIRSASGAMFSRLFCKSNKSIIFRFSVRFPSVFRPRVSARLRKPLCENPFPYGRANPATAPQNRFLPRRLLPAVRNGNYIVFRAQSKAATSAQRACNTKDNRNSNQILLNKVNIRRQIFSVDF